MDSPTQTIMHMERVTHLPSKWWVVLTTNTDSLMLDITNLVIDSDGEVIDTSQNLLDNKETKLYHQVIS
jgi:hypothetical protein